MSEVMSSAVTHIDDYRVRWCHRWGACVLCCETGLHVLPETLLGAWIQCSRCMQWSVQQLEGRP